MDKQKAEKFMQQAITKYEDEVRLRIDFEIKINKLHNLNMGITNHKSALDERIKDLEVELTREKKRIAVQDQELIDLKLLATQNANFISNSKTYTEQVKR
jgi:hypothetical protein